jgi:hypothetical protein
MNDFLMVVLMSLAAYRLYRLFSIDEFPPISWARRKFHVFVQRRFGKEWSNGIRCPWCAGFWWSLGVVVAVDLAVSVPLPALMILAVSCLVGLIAQLDG